MIRRAFLQFITSTSAGVVMPKITKPNRPSHSIESSVEPLPSFPLMLVIKDSNNTHHVSLITSIDDLRDYDAEGITDQQVKDLAYRNATRTITGSISYKLVTAEDVIVNPDGTTSFMAVKGQSGDFMKVTF